MKGIKERNKGNKGCRYIRNDTPTNFNGIFASIIFIADDKCFVICRREASVIALCIRLKQSSKTAMDKDLSA
jgi:hypothetical protein